MATHVVDSLFNIIVINIMCIIYTKQIIEVVFTFCSTCINANSHYNNFIEYYLI